VRGENSLSALKWLTVILLSIVLLLFVSVIGGLFTLNATVLNADFVSQQIDNLDITAVTEEITTDSLEDENLPQEVKDLILDVLPQLGDYIADASSTAIHDTYSYIRGDSDNLDIQQLARGIAPTPQFVRSLLDNVDLVVLVEEYLNEQVSEDVFGQYSSLEPYFEAAILDTTAQMEGEVKDIVTGFVDPATDYILGISPTIDVVVSIEDFIENLRQSLYASVQSNVPPQLEELSSTQLLDILDELWEDYTTNIPSAITLDDNFLDTTPQDISESLTEAQEELDSAREYFGFFYLGIAIHVVLALLIIGGIALLIRRFNLTMRVLGIVFIIYGVIEYLSIRIISSVFDSGFLLEVSETDIPTSLLIWFDGFMTDFLSPMEMYAFIILALGIIMLVISLIYHRNNPAESQPI